jgi:hypothetical protein
LHDLGADELLEHATIEGGWSVSDLKKSEVSLRRVVASTYPETTHRWELAVEFFLTWDEEAYRDHVFEVYTREGSDKLWVNHEELCSLDASLDELLELLPGRWCFTGSGWGC